MMSNDNLLNYLNKFGYSMYESKAFVTLLTSEALTGYELSKKSGIPSSKIYATLSKLLDKGLVSEVDSKDHRYVACSSNDLIGMLESDFTNSIGILRKEFENLNKTNTDGYNIWPIKDYDHMITKAREVIFSSENLLLGCIWPEELYALTDTFKMASERGLKTVLVGHEIDSFEYAELHKHFMDYSYLTDRGMQLILINEKMCMLCSFSTRAYIHGMYTRSNELIKVVKEFVLHELYFNIALGKVVQHNYSGVLKEILDDCTALIEV